MHGRLLLIFALAALISPHRVSAQTPPTEPDAVAPAHVAYVEGTATLERDGRPDNAPLNMPLLSGDRLKTIDGRVEVLFADGSALHLDSRTTLDVQSDELVRLIDGRLRLSIAGPARTVAYRVDSPAGSVRIAQPGEYRIALLHGQNETQLELAVLRGGGEIFTDEGTTPVRAGERAYASAGLAPSYTYAYNSATWDAFDRWSESRRDTRLGLSTQYLPSEVRAYASTFDTYGDWRYQEAYGYVWYPRVDVAWRPYYYGRWVQYPRYGWTWIGVDHFAWPTHHYGRWGFSAGTWFWIPGGHWAPAYVSWAYAPGYVSWCPLGFNNRPVIAVNVFNVGPGYYSSARAWTAVGYSQFGRAYVHQRAVNWNQFDRGHYPAFQSGRSAPASRDVAVPRGSTPIRWTGAGPSTEFGTRPSTELRAGSSTGLRTRTGVAADVASQPTRGVAADVAGQSAAPRYINRGDAIVRSRTERPSAPVRDSAVPSATAQGRTEGRASATASGFRSSVDGRPSTAAPGVPSSTEARTVPGGAARRIDAPGFPAVPDGAVDRARTREGAAGRYMPRAETPVAPQRVDPIDRPQPYGPGTRAPQAYSAPQAVTRPQPAPNAPPPPPPSAGRESASPRPAPSPAPSSGTAVPRDPGSRGAPAASAPSGARSRGRGGR